VVRNPGHHCHAKPNDPLTWTNFESAYRYLKEHLQGKGRKCGLSFALKGDGIVGIDLDKCRNVETGEIKPWAVAIMKRFPGYWELSPSGTGIHGFLRGKLPVKGRRKGNIEVYAADKFLSVTGRRLTDYGADGATDGIEDHSAELAKWHQEVFGAPSTASTSTPSTEKENIPNDLGLVINNPPPKFDWGELEDLWDTAPQAKRLFEGSHGRADQSAAEQSLANYAINAGWTPQRTCDLLVQARLNVGEQPKHLGYYVLTIGKAVAAHQEREAAWQKRHGHAQPSNGQANGPTNGQAPPAAPEPAPPVENAVLETDPSPTQESPAQQNRNLEGEGTPDRQDRQDRRVRRVSEGCERAVEPGQSVPDGRVSEGRESLIAGVMKFVADYIVMSEPERLVVACWVVPTHLMEVWDLFPHLAITSPEKRCGKSTLLELLGWVVFEPQFATNIAPAAMYRLIQKLKPTLLMDEAQSLQRHGSEASEVTRELINGSISKSGKVIRCIGKNHEPATFSIYCPKVIAMIGEPDGILADRCFPVRLKRKSKADVVKRCRSKEVGGVGLKLNEWIQGWVEKHKTDVASTYEKLEPFDIDNDRMADLLLPLQAILKVNGEEGFLELLKGYAEGLGERDRRQESQSQGVRLLAACREIFSSRPPWVSFLGTNDLIDELKKREEEPWGTFRYGKPINPEGLAKLLGPYDIKSGRNKDQSARGYFKADLQKAWDLYLPPDPSAPQENPSIPANPSIPSITAGGSPSANGNGKAHR
jgi:hypothetical protein